MTLKNKIFSALGYNAAEKTALDIKISRAEKEYAELINIIGGLKKANSKYKGETVKITREALKNFPLLKWQGLADGVVVKRRNVHFADPNNPQYEIWNFDTQMIKGAEFGKHFHPDMIESCEVVSGKIIDDSTGKIYHENEIAIFNSNKIHRVRALEDSLLKVLFRLWI